jgi:hypothetical protein
MTFGEDWGAVKDVATKSMRPVEKPAESCARMASAAAGSRATGTRSTEVSHLQDDLESLDFNLSVEQVEALDEASSIEPAQRDKTMTRALAYGGTRDSVIASQASH